MAQHGFIDIVCLATNHYKHVYFVSKAQLPRSVSLIFMDLCSTYNGNENNSSHSTANVEQPYGKAKGVCRSNWGKSTSITSNCRSPPDCLPSLPVNLGFGREVLPCVPTPWPQLTIKVRVLEQTE